MSNFNHAASSFLCTQAAHSNLPKEPWGHQRNKLEHNHLCLRPVITISATSILGEFLQRLFRPRCSCSFPLCWVDLHFSDHLRVLRFFFHKILGLHLGSDSSSEHPAHLGVSTERRSMAPLQLSCRHPHLDVGHWSNTVSYSSKDSQCNSTTPLDSCVVFNLARLTLSSVPFSCRPTIRLS